MDATVTLSGGMAFDVAIGPHHFTLDAKPEEGGQDLGPTPKPPSSSPRSPAAPRWT